MTKAAMIVFADTGSAEALGRVVNALTTAKEFKQAGDEALVLFDGAGTKWIDELSRADHKYGRLFEDVRGDVAGACAYCAEAFGVKDRVEEEGLPRGRRPSARSAARELRPPEARSGSSGGADPEGS